MGRKLGVEAMRSSLPFHSRVVALWSVLHIKRSTWDLVWIWNKSIALYTCRFNSGYWTETYLSLFLTLQWKPHESIQLIYNYHVDRYNPCILHEDSLHPHLHKPRQLAASHMWWGLVKCWPNSCCVFPIPLIVLVIHYSQEVHGRILNKSTFTGVIRLVVHLVQHFLGSPF